ncbi:MAG: hypothetical protein KGH56_00240 [Patescibacteria group bacterium]|nr:hypothetical protein [Patescibacteria group bacterium]
MHGFHHLRKRALMTQGLEPFPAEGAWKRFLDYLMYGVGILAPVALVPQILQIYGTKSGAGVSLLTWTLLTVFNMLWAFYGAVHKDKQLFFANAFIALFDIVIVVGILLY